MAGLLRAPLPPMHRPLLKGTPVKVQSRRVTEGMHSGQDESRPPGPPRAEMLGLALRVCRLLRVRP